MACKVSCSQLRSLASRSSDFAASVALEMFLHLAWRDAERANRKPWQHFQCTDCGDTGKPRLVGGAAGWGPMTYW